MASTESLRYITIVDATSARSILRRGRKFSKPPVKGRRIDV
jgi:hypothetical protein